MSGGDVEAMWRARDAQVPMGHMGDAWDVANAALFLASDESKYVTGIELDRRWRDHGEGELVPSSPRTRATAIHLCAVGSYCAIANMPPAKECQSVRHADRPVQELHRHQRGAADRHRP